MDIENIIEYPDAPSGSVTFYNYKEPLMKFPSGYGYIGALIFDTENEKIQCHYCGEWFDNLSHHLHREHAMSAGEYKKEVGLNKSTALINEKTRLGLIERGLESRKKNLRPCLSQSEETRKKISDTLKEVNAEKQNLRNTCPDQLLSRLLKLHNSLGRTPRRKEVPFINTLEKVHGSFKNACELVGIAYREPGKTLGGHHKYTKAKIIQTLNEFYVENGRFPKYSDNKGMFSAIKKRFDYKELKKEALLRERAYVKPPTRWRWNKDELIEFLRQFERTNGRRPTYSDCKRGLLPNLSKYTYNFGGWQNALKIAFQV